MTLPNGKRLVDHPDFQSWKARATDSVSIDATAAKRLGLNKNQLTLAELVSAVKSARMTLCPREVAISGARASPGRRRILPR